MFACMYNCNYCRTQTHNVDTTIIINNNNDIIINDEYVDIPDKHEDIDFFDVKDEMLNLHVQPQSRYTHNSLNLQSIDSLQSTNFNCSASFQSINFSSIIDQKQRHSKSNLNSSFANIPHQKVSCKNNFLNLK